MKDNQAARPSAAQNLQPLPFGEYFVANSPIKAVSLDETTQKVNTALEHVAQVQQEVLDAMTAVASRYFYRDLMIDLEDMVNALDQFRQDFYDMSLDIPVMEMQSQPNVGRA